MLNGFLVGMFIEGGARWGYDPIWYHVQALGCRPMKKVGELFTVKFKSPEVETTLVILN